MNSFPSKIFRKYQGKNSFEGLFREKTIKFGRSLKQNAKYLENLKQIFEFLLLLSQGNYIDSILLEEFAQFLFLLISLINSRRN